MVNSEDIIREYLSTYYSQEIVETAIDAAKKEIEYNKKYDNDMFKAIITSCIEKHPEIKEVFEYIYDMYKLIAVEKDGVKLDSFSRLYAHAIQYAIEHPNIRLNAEPKCEYTKNKDFAFVLYFHDNDFGGYIEEAAKRFANEYNILMSNIDLYSNRSKTMIDSYVEDLKRLESKDTIKELFRRLFAGAYMSNACDRVTVLSKEKLEPYTEYKKKVEHYIEYLFDDAEWWFGNFADIEKKFLEVFDRWDGTDASNIKECWCNGEVLVMRVVNGEMMYEIK